MTTCFHHTTRETGRACTRCGRPACPDCLHDAAVGAHCWECVREARPPARERVRRASRVDLIATKALVAANVVAFVAMQGGDQRLHEIDWSLYGPAVAAGDAYRLVTSGFVHFGVVHMAFNMIVLYEVGRALETGAGSARFLSIYAVSLLGGSAGALLLTPNVFTGGASGAVFGVAAAATVALSQRGVRFSDTRFGPLLAINLLLTFLVPRISVGGHLGGLVAGAVTGSVLLGPRANPAIGYLLTALVGVLVVVLSLQVA